MTAARTYPTPATIAAEADRMLARRAGVPVSRCFGLREFRRALRLRRRKWAPCRQPGWIRDCRGAR